LLLGIRPPTRDERGLSTKFGLRRALIAMLIIAALLLAVTISANRRITRDNTIMTILTQNWLPDQAEVVDIEIVQQSRELGVRFTVIDYTGNIGTSDIAELQTEISDAIDGEVILRSSLVRSQLDVVDQNTIIEPTPSPTTTAVVTPTATLTVVMTRMIGPRETPTPRSLPTIPIIGPTDTPPLPTADVTPAATPGETAEPTAEPTELTTPAPSATPEETVGPTTTAPATQETPAGETTTPGPTESSP